MADWKIEEKVLLDAVESINRRMDICFSAELAHCGESLEPLVLVRDGDGIFIYEIYYNYCNNNYSIVPRGTLACIADGTRFARCSIHNGFGFLEIPYGFLESIYNKWKNEQRSEIKKENKMNIIDKEFSLADQMLGKLKKYGIKYRMNIGKNGIYKSTC